jgi:predicted Zn-dependent protease
VDEKLTARAKLIYERDSNSPLFLRTADYFLKNNNPQVAHSILEKGMEIFPEHPLVQILMAKAQYILGNIKESEACFRKASQLLNSEETFTYYKKKFNLPDKRNSPFDSSRGNIFMNSQEDFNFDEDVANEQAISDEEDFKDLAEKLMNARIDRNEFTPATENYKNEFNLDKSKLVTETLANIYLSQGQKTEAIKIFELLASRNPGKREYFLEKIRKIKSE